MWKNRFHPKFMSSRSFKINCQWPRIQLLYSTNARKNYLERMWFRGLGREIWANSLCSTFTLYIIRFNILTSSGEKISQKHFCFVTTISDLEVYQYPKYEKKKKINYISSTYLFIVIDIYIYGYIIFVSDVSFDAFCAMQLW